MDDLRDITAEAERVTRMANRTTVVAYIMVAVEVVIIIALLVWMIV